MFKTTFRKARQLYLQSCMNAFTYRAEILIWFALDMMPIAVLFVVWSSVLKSGDQVAGYTLASMLQYYFFTALINGVSSTHFEAWRVEEIRNGKIDHLFLRPFSYLWEILVRDLGGKSIYCLLILPVFTLVYLGLLQFTQASLLSLPSATSLGFALLFVLSAYAIEFFLALLVVLAGFWIEGAEGLEHFKWITVTLLSGSMIPVALMPDWLQQLVAALPFRYMYSVPIGLIQNTATISWGDGVYLISFISVLWATVLLLWRFARYEYASSGG